MPSYLSYLNRIMDAKDDNIESWITVRGKHIPIMKGQSKEEAVKSAFSNKSEKGAGKKESGSAPKRIDAHQIKQYNVISFRKDGRKYEVLGWKENGEAHLRDIRTNEKIDRKIRLTEPVFKHMKGTTKYIDTEKK